MPTARPSFLTLRAMLIGLVLAPVIGASGPFFSLYIQGSNTGGGFYTNPMSHFLLFVIVGFFNVVIGACRRSWALDPGELITVYILMTLGNQSISMAHYWGPMLAGPYYYATPENDWIEQLHPYIPDWIAPHRCKAKC